MPRCRLTTNPQTFSIGVYIHGLDKNKLAARETISLIAKLTKTSNSTEVLEQLGKNIQGILNDYLIMHVIYLLKSLLN